MFVPAEDMVVYNGATDLKTTTRMTHLMRKTSNEIRKLQVSGLYRDVELNSPDNEIDPIKSKYGEITGETVGSGIGSGYLSGESVHTLLEVQVELDLEEFPDEQDGEATGIAVPYVVTIDKGSSTILSIRRNYYEDDPHKMRRDHFVHYEYIPGLGFYGLGLVHLIGGLVKSATSILRQLVDAGTLSNLPGGLKARGMRIKADDTPIMPGEFRDVDVPGGTIKENISFLPYKEPSGTLYQLLNTITEESRRFASMADMKISEMGGETPVGTTMAVMERGTKVMSAIHKRLHYSQKIEFKLLSKIFAGSLSYPYVTSSGVPEIIQADFDDRIDVIPVSDPNIFSMSQRIALAQTQLQLVQSNPDIHGGQQGLYQAYRKMYEALGVSNIDTILPMPKQPMPMNPAKENQEAMRGQRLQAFPEQNHEAHIESHLAILSTPVAQANATIVMTLQGHIQEHIGLMAEMRAEQEVLSALPPEQQMMIAQDPSMMQGLQNEISNVASVLIGELTEQYAQAVAPADTTDPLVAIRQQELALRGAEIQRKAEEFEREQEFERQKEQNDILLGQQRLDLQEEALKDKTRVAEERIQTQRDIAAANLARRS